MKSLAEDFARRLFSAQREAALYRDRGDYDLAMYFDGKAEAFSQARDMLRRTVLDTLEG